MALVIPVPEAVGAERHALGNAASLTTECYKVSGPDEPAHDSVVVLLHVVREVVRGPPPSHQPPAPVNCLPVIDVFLGVQKVVQQGLE